MSGRQQSPMYACLAKPVLWLGFTRIQPAGLIISNYAGNAARSQTRKSATINKNISLYNATSSERQ